MTKKTICIIGAGPAGLSAAYELSRSTTDEVFVLEKAAIVGGISRTESYKGYSFDIGGHRFFTKNDFIKRLWDDILKDDFIRVKRLSRLFYQEKFYHYPIRLLDTCLNLGPYESFCILVSYFKAVLLPMQDEKNFESWVSNRFGDRLFRIFFKTYTEKVWGISCKSIRSDWAVQRIQGLSLTRAVTNALFRNKKIKTLIDQFDYPQLGPGMMWEGLKKRIELNGGIVQPDAEVTMIKHNGGCVTGIEYHHNEEIFMKKTDHIISSTPINLLVRLFEPAPPQEVINASFKLSYRSFLIVVLMIKQKDLFPDQWIYIHNPDVNVGRVQNFKNWSASMVPDMETSSIGMEYFCSEDDDLWAMADDRLSEMAAGEFDTLGLGSATDVFDYYVVRQSAAYPVYDETYDDNLTIIRTYLSNFKNLQTIGRNGMHRYNNMDHSMLTGVMAAQNFNGANFNLWDINCEDAFLEEEVLLDSSMV